MRVTSQNYEASQLSFKSLSINQDEEYEQSSKRSDKMQWIHQDHKLQTSDNLRQDHKLRQKYRFLIRTVIRFIGIYLVTIKRVIRECGKIYFVRMN